MTACPVCGDVGDVDLRAADDPEARSWVVPCPHCGPLNLPRLETTRHRSAA